MGLGGRAEGVGVGDAELEGAVGHPGEDVAGALFEVFAGGDVVLERGPRDVEGAHGGEADEVEGRNGAGGSAEEDKGAAGAEAAQGGFKGGFTYGVVDDRDAVAGGDLADAGDDVFGGVEDDIVGTGGAGQGGFFVGGDGGDDVRAQAFRELDEQEAGAARPRMDEEFVSELGDEGGVQEVVRGHSLKDRGGSLLRGEGVGDLDEAGSGRESERGVGAGDAAPGDAVSGVELGDVRGYGDDGAGGFLAQDVGESCGVAAFAEVGVDEVNAGGFDADEGLARAGGGVGEGF